jgi:hypothetical protein
MCRICGWENFHALCSSVQLIVASYILNGANWVVIVIEPFHVGCGKAAGDAVQPASEVVNEVESRWRFKVKRRPDIVVRV